MKGKRLLSTVLACTLVAGLCMTSASAKYYSGRVVKDGEHFVIYAFHDITYTSRSGKEMTYDGGESWAGVKPYTSLEEIYRDFADPDNEDTHFKNVKDYTDPEPKVAIKETDDLSILVLSVPGEEENSLTEQLVVSNREAQIGTYNLDEAVTLKLNAGAKVENGVLLIMNDSPAGQPTINQNMDIELGAPITVGEGGHLILDTTDLIGGATPENYKPERANKLIAPVGQSAIEVNGGKVEIAFQEIVRAEDDSSEEPLIDVQSGEASFVMNTGRKDNDGLPMYGDDVGTPGEDLSISLDNGESSAPAVAVAEGASATIKGGELTSSGAPVFELAEGASLTLKGGTISNTSEEGTPAIEVAGGAELIYADGADVEISAADVGEEGAAAKAVSLGAGAKVQVADTKVTVASAEETEETKNYIDNHGVMVLSAGATKGEDNAPMNAALVMGDGTIIEGSESAAPIYTVDEKGKITTAVPAGGKVTDSKGGTVEMPNGGSVTSSEEDGTNIVKVPATSISLNESSVTLYSNTTPNTVTLIATVEPNTTTDTVTWSSDNASVATVSNGVVTAVANGTATITAKAGDKTATCTVTVKTYSSGGGSSSDDSDPTYSISTPDKVTGGSIKVTPSRASAGTRVTITAKPSSGYELDELTVTDRKGNELKVTDRGDNKYTFQMTNSKVEIEVSFTKIEDETPPIPETDFVDVPANAYYADAVKWAVEKGITSGTSATTFSPDMSCTRAQMVTFLWRAAGSPKAAGSNPFTDVSSSAYYYDAVLWAAEQGITSGTSATTFAPDATVTRGQTVTFLYRAAGSPTVTGSSFADVAADAYYADAVAWAVSEDITAGTGGNLFSPDAICTRAQIVTFLYRAEQ